MEKKSAWVPRATATTALVLLVVSGCLKDFDALSAEYGKGGGGSGGKAGSAGHATGGGSSASGGSSGDAGASGEAGAAGAENGGTDQTGGSGHGGASCTNGTTKCSGMVECVDLKVGTPDGSGVKNCGACGTTCSLDNADGATCKSGNCTPTCSAGFANCLTTDNDGCEADVTTPDQCGACGYVCSNNGAASVECTSGHCAPTCAPYYADCNSSSQLAVDDGCELYLDALDKCTPSCDAPSVACDPLQVCNTGTCAAPNGLVVLTTPAPTPDNQASRYADLFNTFPDLTGATVTIRMYAPGAANGTVWIYLNDGNSAQSNIVMFDLATISTKWTDVQVQAMGSFNPKSVKQLTIELHATTTPWPDPTIIYVDSVRSSDLKVNDTNDTGFGSWVKSSQMLIPNSKLDWAAAMP